jgi:ABC-type glycerol-3-phosphate transport system permease component
MSKIMQRIPLGKALFYVSIAVFVFVALLPFYWMLLASVTPQEQLFSIPPNYAPDITFENFRMLGTQIPFLSYLRNSVLFSMGSVALSLTLSFLAAYGFARIQVPGSSILLLFLVLSMALPPIVTVIPLFDVLKTFSMIDTIRGLTLVMGSVLIPFSVWILVSFVKRIPFELEEAAIIDGARLYHVLILVIIPIMLPSLVTVFIINFINAWNNLLFPLVFANTLDAKTLTVSITEVFQARNPFGRPWGTISALGVTMVVPMVLLVFAAQRFIISGLTKGSIK